MNYTKSLACISLTLALAACNGDDGTTASASSTSDSTTDGTGTAGTTSMGGTGTAGTSTMGGTGTDSATMGTSVGTETQGTTATTDTTASTGTTATTDTTASTGTTATTDTTGVTGTTGGGICGDGNIDAGEECDDGNDIAGDGCEPDCTVTPNPCGNGMLDMGEVCDGDMFAGETDCKALDDQYSGGTVSCGANCQLDFATCEKCEAPGMVMPCDSDNQIGNDNNAILRAMELACDTAGFMDANTYVPVSNYMFQSPDNQAYRIGKSFGTYQEMGKYYWSPRKGDRFLLISSGRIPAPNAQGNIQQTNASTSNSNPDNLNKLPGIMSHVKGSNNGNGGTPFMMCDGVDDCSDTLDAQWNLGTKSANDILYFQFNVNVPKGTYGYNVDFAYFSEELPEWVNSSFNDMAILWQVSEQYTGNVTFLYDNNNKPQPLTVTSLFNNGLVKWQGNAAQLANTGFTNDGATDWASVKGPAVPEESLTLAFSVFDKGDTILDTLLIIDNWRWDCVGCVPSEVDSCGVQPQ